MKSCSAREMRELDRRASGIFHIPGSVLMENAGRAVAAEAEQMARETGFRNFVLLAGKGNNGGDALAACRFLHEKGYAVSLFCTHSPEEIKGDAGVMLDRLPEEVKRNIRYELTLRDLPEQCILIDGLLGTGISGSPRGKTADWICVMQESRKVILAIDLPSGLSSDDGSAVLCAPADRTLTMARPKTGMLLGRGPELCGMVHIADIDFPDPALAELKGDEEVFTLSDALSLLKREPFDTFKNRRGHLFTAGGSASYPSAPFLTGEAALRTGAGLVTVFLPGNAEILCSVPKALIVRRFPTAWDDWDTDKASAFAAGPGLTTDPANLPLLDHILSSGKPSVLDADGLNLLSLHPERMKQRTCECILTPHTGEMARLLKAFRIPEGSRKENAIRLAEKSGCTVLLKGTRTITASPDGECSFNLTGSPALATAGSGDVLTGVIGGFLARGYSAWDSVRLGAFFHGLAGERLAPVALFGTGVIADDLPQAVGRCLRIPS